MLTEDKLREIHKRRNELPDKNGNWRYAFVCYDMDALLADAEHLRAEIQRQREEIAALRSVINDIERAVINETVNPPKLQSWIVHRIHAPAPEPAPRRIIPNVRVKYTATDAAHRSGQLGVIVGSAVDYLEIEFEDGLVEGIKRTELQSV